jgi:hypothetical protein
MLIMAPFSQKAMVVFMTEGNKLHIKIGRVLGTVQLYSQNGSVRIALPKSAVKKLHFDRFGNDDDRDLDAPSFVLLETSIGLTICPLGTYASLIRAATENSGLSDLLMSDDQPSLSSL